MRALLQRVQKGSVRIDHTVRGVIGRGLVIFLGVKIGDCEADADYLAEKCVQLRIFSDEQGKFNLSALEVGAELLVISQFTLYADTRKGRRPSFIAAAPPEISIPLYQRFVSAISSYGLCTHTGEFGAAMLVEIHNDGPVTVLVESK